MKGRVLKFTIVARNERPSLTRLRNALARLPQADRKALERWLESLAGSWEKEFQPARNIGKAVIDIDANGTRPSA